ncbi:hypothetical protein J5067_23125, partial [Candidatus Symbiopectobacterium sp. NZEC151]|nr:hypothetical protein [Candidatus Symbiopectobacterium sp. NZEC151]
GGYRWVRRVARYALVPSKLAAEVPSAGELVVPSRPPLGDVMLMSTLGLTSPLPGLTSSPFFFPFSRFSNRLNLWKIITK